MTKTIKQRAQAIRDRGTIEDYENFVGELALMLEPEPVAWAYEVPVAYGYQTCFSETEPTSILQLNKRPLFDKPTPQVDVYEQAKELAVRIWNKHFRVDAPGWEPLDTLEGVVSQICNMVTGLVKQPDDYSSANDYEPFPLQAHVSPLFQIEHDKSRVVAMQAELARAYAQLAACGVAAMCNTRDSAKLHRITKDNPNWSESYMDVCRAVDLQMTLNEQLSLTSLHVQSSVDLIDQLIDDINNEFGENSVTTTYAIQGYLETLRDDLAEQVAVTNTQDVIDRLKKFLDVRSTMRGIDQEEIVTIQAGSDKEATLWVSDLKSLLNTVESIGIWHHTLVSARTSKEDHQS